MCGNNFTIEDKKFMQVALRLAEKGKGTTRPNPMVGAVIAKDGDFVAEGFHEIAGYNHAEINAIESAKRKYGGLLPKGLKMYVTLEPCSVYGRTPPCTESIIENDFSEVIISTLDPNPRVNGQGIAKLKNAGIKVKTGLFKEQAKKVNEIFFTHILKKRPFVCAKVASTIDGNLATSTGDSKWITDGKSRALVQKLRFDYGCVLTGVNTVLKDNPFLYPKNQNKSDLLNYLVENGFDDIKKTFLTKKIYLTEKNGDKKTIDYFDFKRVIIDPSLDININSNIINTAKFIKTIIFVSEKTRQDKNKKANALKEKGAVIETAGIVITDSIIDSSQSLNSSRLDLSEILKILYERHQITSIMLECGPGLLSSFLREGLIDKFLFFIAPKIVGGDNPYSIFNDIGIRKMPDSIKLKFDRIQKLQSDIFIEAYPCLQE